MCSEARLVTPEGRTIVLSAEKYERILDLLSIRPQPPTRVSPSEIRALVDELRGKYAAGSSLTQALLDERRRDREREEARACRHAKPA